jgi:signal transduction histidine kinase
VDPGLSVCGDARLIELLLTNLLENAVKYSAKVPQPTVRFYREGTGAKLTICVTDNGVGFDMRHAAKLFQPFQRLHRQDEFPGIGIGLATVQRIVLRHKGSIWANSTPGQGTTVSFNLPDAVQVNGDVP